MNRLNRINNVLGLDLVTTCNSLGAYVHEVEQYVAITFRGRNIMHIRVNRDDQLLLDVRESNLTEEEKLYFNAHVMKKCQWTMNCRTITDSALILMQLVVVVLAKEIIK